MISVSGGFEVGEVKAFGTSGRGLSVDEVADLALNKMLGVADSAPPVIRDQAQAFKERLRSVLVHYMRQAVRSDRTTLFNQLNKAGQHEAANLILKL
jgi:hypothetical protein